MDIFQCNNCLRVIEENRFKCMECHDFDLCQACCLLDRLPGVFDDDHDHKTHTFLKITTPRTSTGAMDEGVMILKILDAMELLLLDYDSISDQVGIPVATVKRIIDNMFSTYIEETGDCCIDQSEIIPTSSVKDIDFIEPSVDESWKMLVGIAEATDDIHAEEELCNILEVPELINMTMAYYTISCMTQYRDRDVCHHNGTSTLGRIMNLLESLDLRSILYKKCQRVPLTLMNRKSSRKKINNKYSEARNIIRTYIMNGQVDQYHMKLESARKLFPCIGMLLDSYQEQRASQASAHRQVTPDIRRSSRRLTPSPRKSQSNVEIAALRCNLASEYNMEVIDDDSEDSERGDDSDEGDESSDDDSNVVECAEKCRINVSVITNDDACTPPPTINSKSTSNSDHLYAGVELFGSDIESDADCSPKPTINVIETTMDTNTTVEMLYDSDEDNVDEDTIDSSLESDDELSEWADNVSGMDVEDGHDVN